VPPLAARSAGVAWNSGSVIGFDTSTPRVIVSELGYCAFITPVDARDAGGAAHVDYMGAMQSSTQPG
jgi:hypothetical protein